MIVCKSYITDGFVGFNNGLVYNLADGSAWKIVDLRCRFGSQIRPNATVRKRRDDYLLKVAGIGIEVEVVQVEPPSIEDPDKPLPRSRAAIEEWFMDMALAEIAWIQSYSQGGSSCRNLSGILA